MGGVCSNDNQVGRPVKDEQTLRLYGDFLNQDTRSLYIILQMSGVDFEFKPVDTLQGENTQEGFQ